MPFSLEALSEILRIPEARLRLSMDDESDPLGIAIKRGRKLGEAELFKKIINLSKQGSGPAQTMLRELYQRNQL